MSDLNGEYYAWQTWGYANLDEDPITILRYQLKQDFPTEETRSCLHCGRVLTPDELFDRCVLWSRGAIRYSPLGMLCRPECRTAWWTKHDDAKDWTMYYYNPSNDEE